MCIWTMESQLARSEPKHVLSASYLVERELIVIDMGKASAQLRRQRACQWICGRAHSCNVELFKLWEDTKLLDWQSWSLAFEICKVDILNVTKACL